MAFVSLGIRTSASDIRNTEQPVTHSSHTADTTQDNSASELEYCVQGQLTCTSWPSTVQYGGAATGSSGQDGTKTASESPDEEHGQV